jgi:phenylpropionate dioxygenase-like ring-hydroxylating dioxygenase large terminal subunit
MIGQPHDSAPTGRRRFVNPVPLEGEDGVFSQTWYPICRSSDVPVGRLLGVDFLDGRVVVFRGRNGVARVMSAYCPHVGPTSHSGTW